MPPDREWIPGYWAEAENQWQWTSGYWEDESQEEVSYLPQPPKTIERGPSVAAVSDEQFWVSGSWERREERYAWRTGYWETGREGWIWIPSHYRWTRRGYVFVSGYWDYDVARRGIVFAPVRFREPVYLLSAYRYRPAMVISLTVFVNHLFVRPRYAHYYFGDYYEPRYLDHGYYASCDYLGRGGYDPIFVHERWRHRDNRDWVRQRRDDFQYYRDHVDQRPPRTYAALRALPEDRPSGRDRFAIAEPFSKYVSQRQDGHRFQGISDQDRERIVSCRKDLRDFSQERRKEEFRPDKAGKNNGKDADDWVKQKKSPVAGKRANQLTGKEAPPTRPKNYSGDWRKDLDAKADGRGKGGKAEHKMDGSRKGGNKPDDRGKGTPSVNAPDNPGNGGKAERKMDDPRRGGNPPGDRGKGAPSLNTPDNRGKGSKTDRNPDDSNKGRKSDDRMIQPDKPDQGGQSRKMEGSHNSDKDRGSKNSDLRSQTKADQLERPTSQAASVPAKTRNPDPDPARRMERNTEKNSSRAQSPNPDPDRDKAKKPDYAPLRQSNADRKNKNASSTPASDSGFSNPDRKDEKKRKDN